MKYTISGNLTKEKIANLKAGDEVLYSGTLYTARDQAHMRMAKALAERKKLPIDLKGAAIYYAGPTPSRIRNKVGACGPTTSSRMDEFTPALLKAGISAMIGKGQRSDTVRQAIKRAGAVYFLTMSGAGAYLARRIKKAVIAAYMELGPEAIYRMEVQGFPLIVGIDSKGKDVYR